jgi:hypothetical protein
MLPKRRFSRTEQRSPKSSTHTIAQYLEMTRQTGCSCFQIRRLGGIKLMQLTVDSLKRVFVMSIAGSESQIWTTLRWCLQMQSRDSLLYSPYRLFSIAEDGLGCAFSKGLSVDYIAQIEFSIWAIELNLGYIVHWICMSVLCSQKRTKNCAISHPLL